MRAGQVRQVVSFYFDILHDGRTTLQGIKQQAIDIETNYTYEEADELIETQETFWGTFSRYLEAVRLLRLEEGALDFPHQEVEIKTQDAIQITLVDRNTAANRLIEELAVLVNQTSGAFFCQNQIPALYRTQTYDILQEPPEGEPFKRSDVRLASTQTSTIPAAHQALGCLNYVQNTSPIRRFSDLVMQSQMTHFLQHQTPLFDEDTLIGYMPQIDTRQRAYNSATKDLETHWKFKYLKQHEGETFTGRIQKKPVLWTCRNLARLPFFSPLHIPKLTHLINSPYSSKSKQLT